MPTLAHRGVLTVEDLPEFSTRTVEALRPALEDGTLGIAAAGGAVSRPAGARMVFTMRDCLCGCARTEDRHCTPGQRAHYLARIPLWLLDRIDLFIRQVTATEPGSRIRFVFPSIFRRDIVCETSTGM